MGTLQKLPETEVASATEKKRGRKPKASGQGARSESRKIQPVAIPSADPGKTITMKVIAATRLIKKIEKRSASVDGYKFVSIDDYYEQVAQVIADEIGLSWILTEETHEEQRFEDVYQDRHIRKVFNVVFLTEEGFSMQAGARISVTMPYEGATTAGKMLSYAEKAFMRSTFKIAASGAEAEAENSRPVQRSEVGAQRDAAAKDKFFSEGVNNGGQ